MSEQLKLNLDPEQAADPETIKKFCSKHVKVDPSDISSVRIIKRSVDARKKNIRVIITVEIFFSGESVRPLINPFTPENVSNCREVLIVGAGPAGLFAAMRLIELGLKPVILERGKLIPGRKRDIARITREHIVDPDSNYCFGTGGAGTFSDGKLYTRSKKRGDNSRILELLVLHGAEENILYESHPHLGTDKLPRIINNILKSITDAGGQYLPEKRVTDLILENDGIKGVTVAGNERYLSDNVILATGHSSRDIYDICIRHRIALEMKPFAMGVRVEHPQELINRIQYHGNAGGKYLPAASYSIVRQVDGRGVYSFCMCPGGFIVPAATSQEEIVVNGMSPSHRNSPYANSGIVVGISPEDLGMYSEYGEMAGLYYQKYLEREAWINGDRSQRAPAQRLSDFVAGKNSSDLPPVSYTPGVVVSPLHEWLPAPLGSRLREGFRIFGSVMRGFLTNEAIILAVESRTSSPVRITRNADTMEHTTIRGLYPCGEGSGYAGGIVSSAIDGMLAADALSRNIW